MFSCFSKKKEHKKDCVSNFHLDRMDIRLRILEEQIKYLCLQIKDINHFLNNISVLDNDDNKNDN